MVPMLRAVPIAVLLAACAAGHVDDEATPANNPPSKGMDPSLGGGTKPGTNGAPEICDGKDNDGNGIIDDVDVGHDGVCDCLTIATIGRSFSPQKGVFGKWLDSRSNNGAVDLADQKLTKALLDPYKVIIALDTSATPQNGERLYDASEVDVLRDWVNAGGGFMTMVIGFIYAPEVENANALLAPFGMSYDGNHGGYMLGGGYTLPVTHWSPHPITAGITRIGMDNGYPVLGSGSMIANEAGQQALEAKEVGAGHVVAWGDEWITFDGEWNAHPDYQVEVLWLNILKWLTKNGDCQVPKPPK